MGSRLEINLAIWYSKKTHNNNSIILVHICALCLCFIFDQGLFILFSQFTHYNLTQVQQYKKQDGKSPPTAAHPPFPQIPDLQCQQHKNTEFKT